MKQENEQICLDDVEMELINICKRPLFWLPGTSYTIFLKCQISSDGKTKKVEVNISKVLPEKEAYERIKTLIKDFDLDFKGEVL